MSRSRADEPPFSEGQMTTPEEQASQLDQIMDSSLRLERQMTQGSRFPLDDDLEMQLREGTVRSYETDYEAGEMDKGEMDEDRKVELGEPKAEDQESVITIKEKRWCLSLRNCWQFHLAERDWSGNFFKIKYLFWILFFYGVAFGADFVEWEENLWGEPAIDWLYFWATIWGALYAGALLDYFIFLLVDLVLYFKESAQAFYYLSAFEGWVGWFIAGILFWAEYHQLLGRKYQNVDRGCETFVALVVGMILHRLVIKILMRKSLIQHFNQKLNEIILYKKVMLRLSSPHVEEPEEIITKQDHDVNWKILKTKDTGFYFWLNQNQQIEIRQIDRIRYFGEIFWQRLMEQYPVVRNSIRTTQLLEWCGVAEEDPDYQTVGELFDRNQDTFVQKPEFLEGMIQMFYQWKNLRKSLLGHSAVSKAISVMSGSLFVFIELMVILNIFEIEPGSVFTPIMTLIISLSFAIAGIVTQFVSSLIFIGVIHPFNVGDRIQSPGIQDGNTVVVKEINIFTTVVKEVCTGKLIWIPNSQLRDHNIANLGESKDVTIVLDFCIGATTVQSQLERLKQEILAYLVARPGEWKPKVSMYHETADPAAGKMKISFWMSHQGDWMQGHRVGSARGYLQQFIVETMTKLKIEYTEFVLPVSVEHLKNE